MAYTDQHFAHLGLGDFSHRHPPNDKRAKSHACRQNSPNPGPIVLGSSVVQASVALAAILPDLEQARASQPACPASAADHVLRA